MYHVLSGTGEIQIGGDRRRISKGVLIWIPRDVEHGVFCGDGENLQWLYVVAEDSFDSVKCRFRHEEEARAEMLALRDDNTDQVCFLSYD